MRYRTPRWMEASIISSVSASFGGGIGLSLGRSATGCVAGLVVVTIGWNFGAEVGAGRVSGESGSGKKSSDAATGTVIGECRSVPAASATSRGIVDGRVVICPN
jgi:hypothetical protein